MNWTQYLTENYLKCVTVKPSIQAIQVIAYLSVIKSCGTASKIFNEWKRSLFLDVRATYRALYSVVKRYETLSLYTSKKALQKTLLFVLQEQETRKWGTRRVCVLYHFFQKSNSYSNKYHFEESIRIWKVIHFLVVNQNNRGWGTMGSPSALFLLKCA